MTERAPTLVLGLGNELFTDEGVGVAAARRIADRELPGVEVLDGGTLGIALLPTLEGRDALLVLDAVAAEGAAAGEVLVVDALEEPFRLLYSAHQIGIAETLAAARLVGRAPGRVTAVGMVPFSLGTGYGLSEQAAGRLDDMVLRALEVLAGWGIRERSNA